MGSGTRRGPRPQDPKSDAPAAGSPEYSISTLLSSAQSSELTAHERLWCSYCAHASKRRPDELSNLKADVEAGRRPDVSEPALMLAAIELAVGLSEAGLKKRNTNWLPPPTADDLTDPAAWVTRRLAEQRVVQNEAERIRRGQQKLARDLGLPRPAGSGIGKPVYLQQPRLRLDELVQRVERAISRPGFQRQWLDPNSKHYDRSADGVSNKQIIMLAGLITGRQEPRSFDENWKIVTEYLDARRGKPQ
jgi:hypothetical protein